MDRAPLLNGVRTSVLEIAYEESGPPHGAAVLLMHGFPYDPRTYDDVVPSLAEAGCRVIVPYLRGYGPTKFLAPDTLRSGQQAALGNDLKELMDALALKRAMLAGYDWGGRGACIVAALWPERVRGLVSANGYNIQDIAGSAKPAPAEQEYRLWYQYYFHTERGRAGLQANRREFCRLLWRLWSPNWKFDDATYDRTAASFDNPDFVDVVIHSYRHRFGYAPSGSAPRCRPPGSDRTGVGRQAAYFGPDDRTAWRRQRPLAAGKLPQARRLLYRPLSASSDPDCRPQSAAGSTGRLCRCRSRIGPRNEMNAG